MTGARTPRVCVVRQFYFPRDIRVRREVDALLAAGYEVDVVCLREPGERSSERVGALTVRRLPMSHTRGGAFGYAGRYLIFLLIASWVVALRHVRRRYDIVQVHSLPDLLVLVGVVPRLLGARVLLDLHEVMPEFFATKFRRPPTHPLVRLVALAEQLSIRVSDHCLTCTEQMRETFVGRGAPARKLTVVLNAADESVFDVRRFPPRPGPGFTLICHGTIEERYGLDTVVDALPELRRHIPGLLFQVYGEGTFRAQLVELARVRGVSEVVQVSDGLVPMSELLEAISRADVGIVALKRDAFRDLTHCNKMYEYIALRLPVASSRTRSVEAYFPDTALQYFEAGDAQDLTRAILELHGDSRRREQLVQDATAVVEPYRWERQREIYLLAVAGLLRPHRQAPAPTRRGAPVGVPASPSPEGPR